MNIYVIASLAASLLLLLLAASCEAAPNVYDNKIENMDTIEKTKTSSLDTYARVAKYLGSCFESENLPECMAVKGLTVLNRVARSNNIVIANGIKFTRNSADGQRSGGRSLSENEIISQLPQNPEERSGRLIDMAMESAIEFLDTHNLEIKVPTESTQEVARSLDEGRAKMKKLLSPFILAIGAKLFALVPILLGGLALLTTKAIIVAKIALLLALAVGASRFFGGGRNGANSGIGGYNSNIGWTQTAGAGQGWGAGTAAGVSGYPYARSLQEKTDNAEEDAQKLAYAGQIQAS